MSIQFTSLGGYRPNSMYFNYSSGSMFGATPFLGSYRYTLNPYATSGLGNFYMGGQMTVDGLANAAFSNSLPLQYTNYGGDYQVSMITPPPSFMTGATYNFLGQQITGTPALYPTFTGGAVNPDPAQVQQNIAGDVEAANDSIASNNIASVIQGTNGLTARLNSAINKDGIENSKKEELKGILKEVNDLKTEAENLKKAGSKDSTEIIDSADALKKTRDMLKKLNELNKKVVDATKAPAQEKETP